MVEGEEGLDESGLAFNTSQELPMGDETMLNFGNRLRDDLERNEMGKEFVMSEILAKNFLDLTN